MPGERGQHGHHDTARLTQHARARCAEMGIGTKVVKALMRTRDTTYVSGDTSHGGTAFVAMSSVVPQYVAVFLPGQPDLVVAVCFHTTEDYVRRGTSFEVVAGGRSVRTVSRP